YPLTAELPGRLDEAAYRAAVEGVCVLAAANPDTSMTVVHDGWPETALAVLPEQVSPKRLGGDTDGAAE
ncbi:MAG: tRNA-guanine(15) transglycosylase, partial [Halovenus sp.]